MMNDRGRLESIPENIGMEGIGEDVGVIVTESNLIDGNATVTAMLEKSRGIVIGRWQRISGVGVWDENEKIEALNDEVRRSSRG
jgi:hypothetical protein